MAIIRTMQSYTVRGKDGIGNTVWAADIGVVAGKLDVYILKDGAEWAWIRGTRSEVEREAVSAVRLHGPSQRAARRIVARLLQ